MKYLFATLSLLAASEGVFGQAPVCPAVGDDFAKLRAARAATPVNQKDVEEALDNIPLFQRHPECFNEYAQKHFGQRTAQQVRTRVLQELTRKIKDFESSRIDKQEGSSGATGGTSSAVAKGPVAESLSLAAEYGALTETVSGQTVTLKGDLAGFPQALTRQGLLSTCLTNLANNCTVDKTLDILQRFSWGVTLDASRDNTTLSATPQSSISGSASGSSVTPVTFTAHRQEISAINGRFQILNHRDTTSADFVSKWSKGVGTALSSSATDLTAAGQSVVVGVLLKYPGYRAWIEQTRRKLAEANPEQLEAIWDAQTEALMNELDEAYPNLPDLVNTATRAYASFFEAQQHFINDLATKTVIAFEYTNNRPLGQPATSNFRLIVDQPFWTKWKVAANGAFTIYDSTSAATPQVKRLRDMQAAAELSYSFGDNAITGPAALSLTGYFQDQRTPAVLNVDPTNPVTGVTFINLPANAKTVLAQAGNIGLAQLRLEIGPKGTSLKIPLAVTYSNRTELIAKPTWRAQVGIAYNFDSLFSK